MVNAAAADPLHYQLAVDAALQVGRALIVETSAGFAAEWCAFLGGGRRFPLLVVLPGHPKPPERAQWQ